MAHAASEITAGTVLDRKIRTSIRGIMDWKPGEFTAFLRSMPASERRQIRNSYGQVCAQMQDKYGQWSTNLMLEWNGTLNKSNFLAAYSQQEAPAELQDIAERRLFFLDSLYERVPLKENKIFGELLSPAYLITGSMPDIKAAYVLYKLQDVFQMQQYYYQDLHERTVFMGVQHPDSLSLAPALCRHTVEQFIKQAISKAGPSNDSLFSRLLLNTCANRFCLEITEQVRLAKKARDNMKQLVEHLRGVFGHCLPDAKHEDEIEALVLKAMATPGTSGWRPFKGHAIKQVLTRARALAEPDEVFNASRVMRPYRWHYRLLTSLAVAWSYCTGDKHDSRLIGEEHRIRDVINGRAKEAVQSYAPSLRLYHSRQFKLLWNSGQMHELEPRRIDKEHGETQFLRDSLITFACMMKKATLEQWALLDAALTTELQGSRWDAQPNMVDIPIK